MGGVCKLSKAIRWHPARRPARCLVEHRVTLDHLEACDTHSVSELTEIPGLLAIDLLDRRKVVADLPVQRTVQACPHEQEDSRGKDTDDERQHARVPQREAYAYAGGQEPHPRSLRRANPTP